MKKPTKYRVCSVILFLLILFPFRVLAQDKSSHIQFHGSNTLVGQYSDMQGVGSEIPPSFYRNDLRMTLTIYDIPISASCFLTSMQRDYRQSMNSFRIYLDVAALQKTKMLAEAKNLVVSSVSKMETTKGELEKYKNQLNTSVLDNTKSLGIVQEEYNKAKAELTSSTSKSNEEVEKLKAKQDELKAKLAGDQTKADELKSKLAACQAKVDELKAKLAAAQAKVEQLKAKVAAAQASLEGLKAKLASAEASLTKLTTQLEQAKSLANTKELEKKGTAYVKGVGLSKMGRFLSNFSALEIGKCRPNYSELTLKGIAVSGANIEFTPGLFYAAFAMGEVKRPIMPSATAMPSFKQNLIFGKLGIGRKNASHLYFTYMQVEEKVNSLPANLGLDTLAIDTLYVKPQANYVLGTEAKLSFFKKKFILEGEAAVSLLTRDMQSPGLDLKNSDVPKWANDFFKPNISSSLDYAYNVKSTLNLKTTIVSVGLKMVGPGYISLGNPNLLNDRMTYEGRIDQTFAKNQLSFSAWYRQNNDNLINWKAVRTNAIAYGIIAGFRFTKLPFLQFSYTPFFQKIESESFYLKNSVRVISASAGHNYKIGTLKSTTMFSFFYQGTETIVDTITINSRNLTYTLNQEIAFKIPLSFAAGGSFNQFEFSNVTRNILLLTLSGTFGVFKNKWQNTLGAKYSAQDYDQDKLGFFLNSRVQLWKMVDLEIRVEKNTFRNNLLASDNYNEFIAQATLAIKW